MNRQRKIERMLLAAANIANGEPVLTGPLVKEFNPPITDEERLEVQALIAAIVTGYTVVSREAQASLIATGLGVVEAGVRAANRRHPGQ
jgi:hypothetical protein